MTAYDGRMLRRRAWALAAATALAGCAAILDVGDVGYGPSEGADGGDAGGIASDATADATIIDGGPDADAGPEVDAAYGDFRDPNLWESATLGDIGLINADQWTCGFFDGARVVYMPRYTSYAAVAFDITKRFDIVGSWTQSPIPFFLDAAAQTTGCAFDGARTYLTLSNFNAEPDYVPFREADGGWGVIDLTYLDAGTYHGRPVTGGGYLHLPSFGGSIASPEMRVVTSGLPAPPKVTVYDSTQIRALVRDYVNAVFVGQYLYLVPRSGAPATYAARVDTSKELNDPVAWQFFDAARITSPACDGFHSATFDGRYVYMWGDYWNGTSNMVVVRVDTTADFQAPGSWEAVDLRTPPPDAATSALYYAGSTFDGRYLYALANNGASSIALARFDTRAAFVASSFDYAPLPAVLANGKIPADARFVGVTFDGQSVYLGPFDSAVARVKIKTPAALPSTAHATFY